MPLKPEDLIAEIAALFPDGVFAEMAYGTIDPAYAGGRPKVTFDGESVLSTKAFPYVNTYTPTAGDRVMLLRKPGGTWTVVGRVV